LTLRFGTQLHLMPVDAFERVVSPWKKHPQYYAGFPWTIKERVRHQPQGFSYDANLCNLGVVHNGQDLVLFHICPHHQFETQLDGRKQKGWLQFIKDIKALGENTKAPLQGLLTGGQLKDPHSLLAFSSLKRLFSELGIQYSILWGQPSGQVTHLACDPKKNSYWVSVQQDKQPDMTAVPNLKQSFSIIQIASS
jgi:hypothetical protein